VSTPGPEPYLSRAGLAAHMGVSQRTIDRWVREGLPHETWGMRTRKFLPSEAAQWARGRSKASTMKTPHEQA
jgi:phage terminase Nu1 subunit (DNA packaging protein)